MIARLRRPALFAALCCLAGALAALSPATAMAFFYPDVRPGYGLSGFLWLSKFSPSLKHTEFDVPVYLLDSGKPGASALVLGGTHPRELAGVTAALILVENAIPSEGRLFVIPCLNASGMGTADTYGRVGRELPVEGRSGIRLLPYGDRYVSSAAAGEDPEKFVHSSGFTLDDGAESRNLNRNYPGKPDGTWPERVTFGVMELIRREDLDFVLDVHEARTLRKHVGPEGKVIQSGTNLANTLICHPQALELGAEALFLLEERGISLKLDQSNLSFRGLSHFEIGEGTNSLAFLSETPNPAMDVWTQHPDPVNNPEYPLSLRVGTALEVFKAISERFGERTDKKLTLEGVPSYRELAEKGVGAFLN